VFCQHTREKKSSTTRIEEELLKAGASSVQSRGSLGGSSVESIRDLGEIVQSHRGEKTLCPVYCASTEEWADITHQNTPAPKKFREKKWHLRTKTNDRAILKQKNHHARKGRGTTQKKLYKSLKYGRIHTNRSRKNVCPT